MVNKSTIYSHKKLGLQFVQKPVKQKKSSAKIHLYLDFTLHYIINIVWILYLRESKSTYFKNIISRSRESIQD